MALLYIKYRNLLPPPLIASAPKVKGKSFSLPLCPVAAGTEFGEYAYRLRFYRKYGPARTEIERT